MMCHNGINVTKKEKIDILYHKGMNVTKLFFRITDTIEILLGLTVQSP
jgi:hypothetical protein